MQDFKENLCKPGQFFHFLSVKPPPIRCTVGIGAVRWSRYPAKSWQLHNHEGGETEHDGLSINWTVIVICRIIPRIIPR